MNDSRIPGLYKLSIAERIAKLEQAGWLTASDADALRCDISCPRPVPIA